MIFNFLAPPLIIKPSQTTIISKRDDTVELQCQATGNPQPTITWRKNRRAVVVDGAKYKQSDSGALVVTSLERFDSGTYLCTASNPTGQDFLILTLHVYSEFDYHSAVIKIWYLKSWEGFKNFLREEVTKLKFRAIALRQSECKKLKLCWLELFFWTTLGKLRNLSDRCVSFVNKVKETRDSSSTLQINWRFFFLSVAAVFVFWSHPAQTLSQLYQTGLARPHACMPESMFVK